jgi:hypothetical protein
MKNIIEMADDEILKLTNEDLELMIKYNKAIEGIKLLTAPIEPKYKEIPKPDVLVYFNEFIGSDKTFINRKDVEAIINILLNSKINYTTYDSKVGYDIYFLKGDIKNTYGEGIFEVRSKNVYSAILWEQVKDTHKENRILKDQYTKDLNEYNSNKNDSEYISQQVYDTYYAVINKYDTFNKYNNMFINEYLPLANNDYDIAMNFICKAYNLNEDQINFIKEHNEFTKEEQIV